jgi:4'-phosphopantetheinyl transferase
MLGTETLWPCRVVGPHGLTSDVRVWAAWLDVDGSRQAAFWSTLCPQEQARAQRFLRERDRVRFVAARGWLRSILGECLGVDPQGVVFGYEGKGKPFLDDPHADRGLQFNLSHSDALGVFAVARQGPVGVDVEKVRPMPDLLELTARFFTPQEHAEVSGRSESEQALRFFQLWTGKEARAKATGEGIAGALGGSDAQGQGAQFLVSALEPAAGYVGAIAVRKA